MAKVVVDGEPSEETGMIPRNTGQPPNRIHVADGIEAALIPLGKTHAGFRYTIRPMANHRHPVRDEEEYRLIGISEACRSDESAAAYALSHPPHSLVYSEYQRLLDALRTTRLKGHQSRIALKAHHHKMRYERPDAPLAE